MSFEQSIETEVDQNYEVFKSLLNDLLAGKFDGKFALMRKREIIEFFESAGDAFRAGKARYQDRLFSVQEVTQRPLDQGYFFPGGSHTDVRPS